MPAPSAETFSATVKVAAQTALRDTIDSGSAAGKLRLRSSADALLWEGNLSDPCGTVNGSTGVLTITMPSYTINASASGTIAYGELVDSNNNVHWAAPAAAGTTAVAGQVVVNTLSAVSGQPLTVISIVFNPPA
jgi:hypothetical protein